MTKKQYWALIPAAGTGKRMGSQVPKQYLPLAGKTVIEQTISVFLKHPEITGVVVVITQGDPYWQDILKRVLYESAVDDKPIIVAPGGKERCYSVLNALHELYQQSVQYGIKETDWVLVHDAARPCLKTTDIDALIDQLSHTSVGGLSGLPMSDTVKRCSSGQQVLETVDRSQLWRALTPQMFPLKLLKDSLEQAIENKELVTDESSAIELRGLKPIIIEGSATNIKITHPGDLELAELFFGMTQK